MMRASTYPPPKEDRGLILMDLSSSAIVSLDRGAAAILNYTRRQRRNRDGISAVDKNLLEAVHRVRASDEPRLQRVFRIGVWKFTCRSYLLESHDVSGVQPLVAVLLERHVEAPDAIERIGAQYHLTTREQQALRGLSLGLSIKALAANMNIKPSTLHAFLRLIKIKMGVATRAGMMVKILEITRS
jgi:DNA-binding NarL/FixJ family response regulator